MSLKEETRKVIDALLPHIPEDVSDEAIGLGLAALICSNIADSFHPEYMEEAADQLCQRIKAGVKKMKEKTISETKTHA